MIKFLLMLLIISTPVFAKERIRDTYSNLLYTFKHINESAEYELISMKTDSFIARCHFLLIKEKATNMVEVYYIGLDTSLMFPIDLDTLIQNDYPISYLDATHFFDDKRIDSSEYGFKNFIRKETLEDA